MTRYLTLRTRDTGGAIQPPQAVDCDPAAQPLAYAPVSDNAVAADIAGRDVVLAIHGFNVSRPSGVGALGGLETALALPPSFRFFGILWPGDFWLPVVDYPWEAAHAVTCGRHIAAYCNRVFPGANSISFISHSLGGRVLLEAVQNMDKQARQVCIAAGAVDDDCLVGQYRTAAGNAGRISVMSSLEDKVLQLAYPAGDFISDVLLGDNDSPWTGALGRSGPRPPFAPPIFEEAIPNNAGFDHKGYNHGDYLPPSKPPKTSPADPKWRHAADYMRRAVTGVANFWA